MRTKLAAGGITAGARRVYIPHDEAIMNTKTKTIMHISVLTFLLVAASSQCFAMLALEDVTTNRAKELGVTIRTNMNGQAGIKVQMEFKTEGELKKITYVELQIGEGESRIISAPLLVSYPSPGRVAVGFSAYPAYLSKCILTIAVYGGPKGDWGYRFKVKDFIEAGFGAGADHQPEDRAHSDWLARLVKQTETIKVGMTRREVEDLLVEDVAGRVNPKTMRYQHPACSYVKLDLEFEMAASGDRKDDKITKRSKALLDLVPNKARF
jgi:hypothetical protein